MRKRNQIPTIYRRTLFDNKTQSTPFWHLVAFWGLAALRAASRLVREQTNIVRESPGPVDGSKFQEKTHAEGYITARQIMDQQLHTSIQEGH